MWTGYLLIPIKSHLLSCKCNLKYSKWPRSKWKHWQLYVALPHIFPHCQHIPVGLRLEWNRAESFCVPTLSCPCMDLTQCQKDKNLVPPPSAVLFMELKELHYAGTHFYGLWIGFCKKKNVLATQAKKSLKYICGQAVAWCSAMTCTVEWRIKIHLYLMRQISFHYCWRLDNVLDFEDHVDKSQTGSLLGILFLSFFVSETWC